MARRKRRAGTVSVRAIARLIALGVAAGIDRHVLLGAARLTEPDLTELDRHVPVAAEIALWQTFARRITDPGFGVAAGAAFQLRPMGLLGYACSFSATLRHALRRLARYGRVFTEAVQVRLDERPTHLTVILDHPALGPGTAFAQDYRLAALLRSCRELSRVHIVPVSVSVTHRQPSSSLAYREFFGCPIRYGAAVSQLVLRASDADLPIPRGDETLAGYLSDHAEHLLATMLTGESVRHAVRAAIWSVLGEGTPTLARVASILSMPERTVQRRLTAEGTTLHDEIDEIRKSMATALLRDRSVSVGDVAFVLGYSEPSAFYRSFKRWTGRTPRQFRSQAA